MATVYFTNNADSGDGSLRDALSTAASGDIVTYSDSAFADTDEIVIPLSSRLAIIKDVVLDARGKRIVLDGQFTSRCLWVSADLQLRKVDLINGYSNSSYSGGLYISQGAVTLDACRIHGCFSESYGSALFALSSSVVLNDCLITGCCTETALVRSASVRAQSGSSVAINRCTIVGDAQRALSAETDGLIVVADSLVQGVYNVPSAVSVTPSTCGFVAPCPDTIDPESWTNTLWQSWDFRLTPESPYLTGAETVEDGDTDLLGNPRQVGGALGAFEGSWLVGSQTISSDTTADYCDFGAGDLVEFQGAPDTILRIAEVATVDGAEFTATNRSYFVTPSGTDVSAATFDGVVACDYGANVTSFTTFALTDTSVGFTIEKTGTANVLLERKLGTNWRIVSTDATNETIDENVGGQLTYRVFDGVNFFVSSVMLPTTFWTIKCWAVAKTNGGSEDKPFVVSSWALDPEID